MHERGRVFLFLLFSVYSFQQEQKRKIIGLKCTGGYGNDGGGEWDWGTRHSGLHIRKNVLDVQTEVLCWGHEKLSCQRADNFHLGLSTHPPGGTEETGGSQLGYATYLVDFWKSVGKVFSCQNDWEVLLVKYSGIHGQTHTVMNFLVQNANDTLSPDTSIRKIIL